MMFNITQLDVNWSISKSILLNCYINKGIVGYNISFKTQYIIFLQVYKVQKDNDG